jgi:hypothetical protein
MEFFAEEHVQHQNGPANGIVSVMLKGSSIGNMHSLLNGTGNTFHESYRVLLSSGDSMD